MGYFSFFSGLEMTAARVASLPVPEEHAFHLRNGFLGTGDAGADTLCAVHRGAAAERDYDVAVVILVELQTFFDVLNGGVGDNLVENGEFEPFRFESVDDGLSHTEAEKHAVGDEQSALEALAFGKRREFFEAAFAGNLLGHAPRQHKFGDIHYALIASAPDSAGQGRLVFLDFFEFLVFHTPSVFPFRER